MQTRSTTEHDVCFLNTSVLEFDPRRADPSFGSDVVILDLEDGVHHAMKAKARLTLAALDFGALADRGLRVGVRVNNLCSIDGLRDLDVVHRLCSEGVEFAFVQLPKVRSSHELHQCRAVFAGLSDPPPLMPIIEVPEAIGALEAIAADSEVMMFGCVDMVESMYRANRAFLDYARGRFCVACASAGIAAVDTAAVSDGLDFGDWAAFRAECEAGKAEGFTAKAVIHPSQIAIVREVFAVSEEELDGYRSTIARYEGAQAGFSIVESRVIAPPFVARAKKMLDLYANPQADRRGS